MKRQYKIYHTLPDGMPKLVKTFAIYDQDRSMSDLRALSVLETLGEPSGEYRLYDTTGPMEPIARRLPSRDGLMRLEYIAEWEK